MAEYVRFVSYLYEYQGNERKKNVGFVRYEVRNGLKRLLVSVNGVRRPDCRLPIYAFYREMNSCIGVMLGTLVIKGGRGSFQYSTYADGPGEGEPECRFEEIAGLVVMGEGEGAPVFCTVWDNEPFSVSLFVRSRADLVRIRQAEPVTAGENPIKEKNEPDSETTDSVKAEQEEAPEKLCSEKEAQEAASVEPDGSGREEREASPEPSGAEKEPENTVSGLSGTESHSENAQNEAARNDEAKSREMTPSESMKDENKAAAEDSEKIRKQAAQDQERFALYRQTIWDKMCKLYPKVMPFPYDYRIRCLRIRPGDIGRLPRENWPLANNSFMLHGFFQYRYILLIRLPAETEEYEERYMIAVPGTYSQMDEYLASMFGFREFLGSPKRGNADGQFGYWAREIFMESNG